MAYTCRVYGKNFEQGTGFTPPVYVSSILYVYVDSTEVNRPMYCGTTYCKMNTGKKSSQIDRIKIVSLHKSRGAN